MGQLALTVEHLGQRQARPVRLEVLAPAAELAVPAVVLAQAVAAVEQQLGEVFQGRQFADQLALHFRLTVLSDGGEAGVGVGHPAVAVDQQEGAGALLHGTLEQVQGLAGLAVLLADDDLRIEVGQFTGKADLVALPMTDAAGVFQAQHADQFAVDAHAGIEDGLDTQRLEVAVRQFAGARVFPGILRVDGAAAVQGGEIGREGGCIQGWRLLVAIAGAVEQADRDESLALQAPQTGPADAIQITGAAGDQLGGLAQRVFAGVAVLGQAHDQALLGA